MDDVQRETPAAQQSAGSTATEARESTSTAIGPGRMLANPRRVRRA